MNKEIKLTKGKVTIVDIEDFDHLNGFNWHICTKDTREYAQRSVKNPRNNISMHRYIMNAKKGEYVDHINGDTLDNRRKNLRLCSNQQNSFNQKKKKNCKSKYKGVKKNNKCNTWTARITFNRVEIYLGSYKTEELAAIVYNEKAKELFGEFAKLNEVNNV